MGWFDQQAQQMPQQGGSLAALGGGTGRNAPIYNPVQPPQQMPTMNPDILKRFMDPSFDPRMEPGFHDPKVPGGSGQPIGPQPVPGMPPQQMMPQQPQQGNRIDPTTGQPLSDQDITNTQQRLAELQKDDWKYPVPFAGSNPNDPRTNEMNILNQRLYGSGAMPMPQMPKIGDMLGNRGSGQPINQPMATSQPLPWDGSGGQSSMGGSLQSLGGGQLNSSGMVNLRGPDGSMKAVPQDQVQHWLSKGATQVGGGSGEQMVNNGWGRMVPKSQQDAFYASGGRT